MPRIKPLTSIYIVSALVALPWFALVYAGVAFGSAASGVALSVERTVAAVIVPAVAVEALLIAGAIDCERAKGRPAYLLLAASVAAVHVVLLRLGVI